MARFFHKIDLFVYHTCQLRLKYFRLDNKHSKYSLDKLQIA